jgi:hypothetical protein
MALCRQSASQAFIAGFTQDAGAAHAANSSVPVLAGHCSAAVTSCSAARDPARAAAARRFDV